MRYRTYELEDIVKCTISPDKLNVRLYDIEGKEYSITYKLYLYHAHKSELPKATKMKFFGFINEYIVDNHICYIYIKSSMGVNWSSAVIIDTINLETLRFLNGTVQMHINNFGQYTRMPYMLVNKKKRLLQTILYPSFNSVIFLDSNNFNLTKNNTINSTVGITITLRKNVTSKNLPWVITDTRSAYYRYEFVLNNKRYYKRGFKSQLEAYISAKKEIKREFLTILTTLNPEVSVDVIEKVIDSAPIMSKQGEHI